jgi:hypothetical protein
MTPNVTHPATPDSTQATAPAPRPDLFAEMLTADLVRAGGDPASLGASIARGLEGFQSRVGAMGDRMLPQTGAAEALPPLFDPSATPALPAGARSADPGEAMQQSYRLIVEVFDFAMETHLVAKAATQFTGSVNTLMKGQ